MFTASPVIPYRCLLKRKRNLNDFKMNNVRIILIFCKALSLNKGRTSNDLTQVPSAASAE